MHINKIMHVMHAFTVSANLERVHTIVCLDENTILFVVLVI